MLVEDDYDSWKIRIQRYIRGKPNGKLIWKSIQNGPTPHPMVTDPPPTGSTIVPAPRKKLDSEFNDEENKLEMADTQAVKYILSQGSSEHIFNILVRQALLRRFGTRKNYLCPRIEKNSTTTKEDLLLAFPPTNNLAPGLPSPQGRIASVDDGHILLNQGRTVARQCKETEEIWTSV
ncbi:hypothetical protein Tco_0013635 [Tanacetum coccineum]